MGSNTENTSTPAKTLTSGTTSAVTAIKNPLGRHVLLFSSTDNLTLGVEQRAFDGPINTTRGDGTSRPPKTPTISERSTLVSMLVDDTVQVYGITGSENQISLLSPVYEPVPGSFSPSGKIAGCGSNKIKGGEREKEGWLYFQQADRSVGETYIYEQIVSNTKAQANRFSGTKEALFGTRLAAFHDGKKRWVVWQQGGPNIIALRNIDDERLSLIAGSETLARKGTELAAVYVPEQPELKINARVYVYFVHKDSNLWRAYADAGDVLKFEGKGAPTKVADGGSVLPDSQLTAVVDVAGQQNFVYAAQQANKKIISGVPDAWQ